MFRILILLSIVSYIDLKAVQYADDPYRGYYDHMYDHMYMRETPGVPPPNPQNYEAQYVPQVDGNPIYVPQYDPSYHEQYGGNQYGQYRENQYEQYGANPYQQYEASEYQQPMPTAPKQEVPKPMIKPKAFPIQIKPEVPVPYPNKLEKPVLKEKAIVKVEKPKEYPPKQKLVPSKDKISDSKVSDLMDYEYDQPEVIDAKLKEKLGINANDMNKEEYEYTLDNFNDPEVEVSLNESFEEYDIPEVQHFSNNPNKVPSKPKDKIKVHAHAKPNKVLKGKPIRYDKEPVKHHSEIKVQKNTHASIHKTNKKPPQKFPTSEEYYEPVEVVESLIKKPIEHNENSEWDSPVVVEALTKRKPQKHVNTGIKHSNKQKVYSKPIYESNKGGIGETLDSKVTLSKFPHSEMPIKIKDAKPGLEVYKKESLKVPDFFDAEESLEEKLPPKETNIDIDLENADETQELKIGTAPADKGSYGESQNFMKSNIWSMMSSFHSQERNKFKKCLTPDNEPGNCMPIQMCPVPNLQLTLDELRQIICNLDDVFIGICCPEFPAETLKVEWDNITEVQTQLEEMKNKEKKPVLECGVLKNSEKLNSWPWMAPLISASTRRIFCGGVLVHNQYVLTAAHCTRKIHKNQILVILGAMTSKQDPTNQEFEVIEIKRHAQYNPRTMQNDIALLKLAKPVDIGEQKRFICLPKDEKFEGKTALMLGWQGSFVESKNEEFLKVISMEECKKGVKMSVSASTVCTEPRTEDVMCNLDSGAPLVIEQNGKYEVIGVLTWNRNDCDSNVPSVFTRVSHFRKWIENHTKV